MKDILQDIVAHTHSLGFLSLVKVSNEEQTKNKRIPITLRGNRTGGNSSLAANQSS